VAVRKRIEHIHVRADALAESAGAGEGSLITARNVAAAGITV
jgi:hypothetical protein